MKDNLFSEIVFYDMEFHTNSIYARIMPTQAKKTKTGIFLS